MQSKEKGGFLYFSSVAFVDLQIAFYEFLIGLNNVELKGTRKSPMTYVMVYSI